MARARNPKRDEAKKIWLDSKGTKHLKDIAEELGLSPSQIRKWKSQDSWSDELNGNVTNDEKERYHSSHRNKNAAGNNGGPPPGNKNAVGNGGGAPSGNHNALITGEYETIDFDTMTDKERELFDGVTDDPLITINTQIRTLKIRQHRIMERIKIRQNLDDWDSMTKSMDFDLLGMGKKVISTPVAGTARQNRKLDDLDRLDSALNAVNAALARAVRQKQQIIDSLTDEKRRLINAKADIAETEAIKAKQEIRDLGLADEMGQLTHEELMALAGLPDMKGGEADDSTDAGTD